MKCASGGIGRLAGFRCRCSFRAWGFDSPLAHQEGHPKGCPSFCQSMVAKTVFSADFEAVSARNDRFLSFPVYCCLLSSISHYFVGDSSADVGGAATGEKTWLDGSVGCLHGQGQVRPRSPWGKSRWRLEAFLEKTFLNLSDLH